MNTSARFSLLVILILAMPLACTRKPRIPTVSHADSVAIAQDNLLHRAEVDSFFRADPGSPFKRDTSVHFTGIRWFPVDPRYRVTSILHKYASPDTVIVMGTKGEERRQLRYGYFQFLLPDDKGEPVWVKLNVYKFTPYDGQRYALFRDNLSVWFTDRTTGKETYDVGRYLEIGNEISDEGHEYELDLNKAFNPYCAYTPMYSCAVPREEDHIDIALRVGEMKYHE